MQGMSNSTNPESTIETDSSRRLLFSLRTLLTGMALIAAVIGLFWCKLHPSEVAAAIDYVLGRSAPSREVEPSEAARKVALAEFSQAFAALPLEVGDWIGKDISLPEFVHKFHRVRSYRHRSTGAGIILIVSRGPTYANSRHSATNTALWSLRKDPWLSDHGLGMHVESIQNAELEDENGTKHFDLQSFSRTGNWSFPPERQETFRKFDELTALRMQYFASNPKSWGNWQEFDAFVVAIFPHLQDALFPHSPGSSAPHGIEWFELPHVLWLAGTVLFFSLVGLIYLSYKKKRESRSTKITVDASE
jgi:hypothetical protein